MSLPSYINTRVFSIYKENCFQIGRTAMIKSWKVLDDNVKITIIINSTPLKLDFLDGKYFDMSMIRGYINDIIPETTEDNILCNIESTLFGAQLMAYEHYKHITDEELWKYMFTAGLSIEFEVETIDNGEIPDEVKIEEVYAMSSVQYKSKCK